MPLVEEPLFELDEGVLAHDTDLLLNRNQTDVVVQGHAYAHAGRPVYEAGLSIGTFSRAVRVFGDRRVEFRSDGLRFTAPKPADKVQLSWERAYGGVDEVARRTKGDPIQDELKKSGLVSDPRFGLFSYPRNPVGRGYLIEETKDAVEACELPNFEDPAHLLVPANLPRGDFLRWPGGPVVASLGWLSYGYFPRAVQVGLPPPPYEYDRTDPQVFAEVRSGAVRPATVRPETKLEARLDLAAAQSSAVGMRLVELAHRAPVVVVNLHPREPAWRFALPAKAPRIGYRIGTRQAQEIQPKIKTILIEPDHDRVCLVWVGEVQNPIPIPPSRIDEIQHVVIWE